MKNLTFAKLLGLLVLLFVLVLSFPGGNPANLFKGSNLSPEIMLMRAGDSVLSHFPALVRAHIDVANVEALFDNEEVKRPDNPGGWAHYRHMQLASDKKGTIAPDGLFKAHKARRKIVAKSTAASSQSGLAGIGPSQWTWIGPGNQGGRIRAILIHPTTSSTLWVGSAGGGIWKSVDSGASWAPVQDFMANLAVTSLGMAANTPSVMYAATGEGFFNFDALRGSGIFKSSDSGVTWSRLAATDPASNADWYYVNRIATHPTASGELLAVTNGGIYRSVTSGSAWTKTSTYGNITDVQFALDNSNRVLASGGSGPVLYSSDSGATWTASNLNLSARVEIAFGSGGVAFAVADQNSGTIYKSLNYGATWSLVSTLGHLSGQGWYANTIWVDPSNNNNLIVGGLDLWRSSNGGASFAQISNWQYGGQYGPSAHADHHAIVSVPEYNGSSKKAIYFGNDGGLYRADDVTAVDQYGTGWINLNHGLGVTQFFGGAGHDGVNGRIVGGTQDNGDLYYPGTGTDWGLLSGGDGGESAIDPTDGNYTYGEYTYLDIHRATNGTGPAQDITYGLSDANDPYNALFIAPFEIDKATPTTMWAGGTHLWRTTNLKGATPTWSSIYSANDYISEIALGSSTNLWFGTTSGNVYKSINATASSPTFSLRNSGLPAWRAVLSLAVDKVSNDTVYAGFGGFESNNLWKTINGGTSWASVSAALPAVPVYAIETQPGNPNRVYIGTEIGIFSSEDAGSTWSATNDGPANVAVFDLFWLNAQTLVAVTHGRGMFKTTVTSGSTYSLAYTKAGTGSGTTSFSPSGTQSSCAASCNNNYASDTVVTLSATPSAGSTFAGWTGGCSGTGTCQLTMSADKVVTATFTNSPTYAVTYTKAGTGSGTTSFSPSGTQSSCAASCNNNYASDTVVTLSATPSAGSTFAGWTGGCSGTGTCQLTMSADKVVTATFTNSPTYAVTYTKAGTGSGTTLFSPVGTQSSCAASCTNSYPPGTIATLSAAPAAGSTFAGWSGGCSGTGDCQVTLSAAQSVTATFTAVPTFAIAYTKAGTGSGTISFSTSDAQSSCATSCSKSYTSGSVVMLNAAPNFGSTFAGWSGGCTGTGTCLVTLTAAKAVTATFTLSTSYAITYTKAGAGSGTTNFAPTGSQASCSASCSNSYASGSVVTLSAAPASGSTFAGWSGGCTGTAPCQLTLSAAKAVTATFNLIPIYAITYTKAGTGTGTTSFSPTGTQSSCAASCSNSYTSGTVVTLSATPATGSTFAGWSGGCTGTSTCQLTLSAAQSVTASYTLLSSYAITYTKAGTGTGTTSFSPTGTQSSCAASCSNSYTSGTVVTLSATPATGSTFAGWSGGCTGTSTCQLTLSAAQSVTASYTLLSSYAITYTKAGTGTGTTSFSPTGTQSSCAASCSNSYTSGTVVTLSATPATGSTFAGWSGECTGTSTCQLTLSAAKAVTATYNTAPTCSGLGCALDDSFTWQTYYASSNAFYSQSTYTSGSSGSSAAQSGYTIDYGYSCMYTTINGPGTLSYIWGVSSEANYDYLNFYYDNSLQDWISGSGVNVGYWSQNAWSITASGSHTIEFCYEKDSSYSYYLDAGFVDKVSFVPSGATPKFGILDKNGQIKRLESTTINRPGIAVTELPKDQFVKKGSASVMELHSPRSRSSD